MCLDLSKLDDETLEFILSEFCSLLPPSFPCLTPFLDAFFAEKRRRLHGSGPAVSYQVPQLEGLDLHRTAHMTLLLALRLECCGHDGPAEFFMALHEELLWQVIDAEEKLQPAGPEYQHFLH